MKRFDLYGRVHKALRAMMAEALLALQRADPGDAAETREARAQLEELLAYCEGHAAVENEFIHRALESRRAEASCFLAKDHHAQESEIEALRAAAASGERDLHRRLAIFIADNFRHMEDEERRGNALLWELFSDAELLAIHRALVASRPREETVTTMRWMLPAMNHAERVEVVGAMRAAPPAVLAAIMGIARSHLRARDMQRLEEALQIATMEHAAS
jgi:hypothetical protein